MAVDFGVPGDAGALGFVVDRRRRWFALGVGRRVFEEEEGRE